MFYLQDLRVRLQERRNRLLKTNFMTFDTELRYFLQFLDENTFTRSMLVTLETKSLVDYEQWASELSGKREVQFPENEEGRAMVCYCILKRCVDEEHSDKAWDWGLKFGSETKFDAMLRAFSDAVVDPFVNFLYDQIDDGGNVLYQIERFKLKAEWFRRKELYNHYQGDTSVGEASLDLELRASLFDGGIDYPFSQPSSPSGKVDIVALLGSDDPLVLEVKVFDTKLSKGKSHLRQGFHQVLRYANDYNQSLGYLVIFNCSERQLVISTEEASEAEFPPRIGYGGKTVFVIPIDIHPVTASASKEKPASRQVIDFMELVEG